jgi:hypothetical protein
MPTQFWRSEAAQEQLNRLDRPGFAAEFLRRNPDYVADCNQTKHLIAQGTLDQDTAQAELARRWGLCFCPRPRCRCKA